MARLTSSILCIILAVASNALVRGQELSKAELAKMGKSATAMVEVDRRIYASAFCVHRSGMFVTNAHPFKNARTGKLRLILHPGTGQQKVIDARLIRKDEQLDLALVGIDSLAEGMGELAALKIGDDRQVHELMDVVVFGFPFGRNLATRKDNYPSISINKGAVSSLRRKDGKLHRIQLDGAVNPGNSGGPILNLKGEIVAVVVGRVESRVGGAGVDLAIPASHLTAFLAKPEITFSIPQEVDPGREISMGANLAFLLPARDKVQIELELSSGGKIRRIPLQRNESGAYVTKLVPLPESKEPVLIHVDAKFGQQGAISGVVKDQPIKVGDKQVQLSDLMTLRNDGSAQIKFADGSTQNEALTGLAKTRIRVGEQSLEVDLSKATSLDLSTLTSNSAASFAFIARLNNTVLTRKGGVIYAKGTRRPTLDQLMKDVFLRPPKSSAPVSYVRLKSSQGDYIGQGKSYEYLANQFTGQGIRHGIEIAFGGFRATFAAPQGANLAVGEYAGAKRHPFNNNLPGISLSGNGRGCNQIAGKFVIWELEMEGNKIKRLAVDFIQRCEGRMPPLTGMIRLNSTFH